MRILPALAVALALSASAIGFAPSSKPPKPPKVAVDNSRQVYVDSTRRVYHLSDTCKSAGSGLSTMTQKQARKAGYTQCKTCNGKKKT